MKLFSRRFSRAALLLALTVLVCVGANMLAFCVDSTDMRDHVWQGCLMLGEQGATPQMMGGFLSAQLDNYTGVLILKTAGYTGNQSLMEKAFGGYRVDMPAQPGQDAWDAYCSYEFGELAPEGSVIAYSRYWHGYTLPLRLALCVLDAANLQMMLYFAQLLLLLLVLSKMGARGLKALRPGFVIAYFMMTPFAAGSCLQYAPVTLLMLAACLLMLHKDAAMERIFGLPACFALLGVLTNYLDLLTFPMATLGFPLVLLLALRMKAGDGFAALFKTTVACGVSWALGFGCMWALKWALNACVFGLGSLSNVFAQIGLRASDNGGELSRFAVLIKNANVILAKKSYLLLIALSAAAALAPAARAALSRQGVSLDLRAFALLLPGAAAALWILVLSNHASDHTYFTYRTLTVALLGGLSWLGCVITPKE